VPFLCKNPSAAGFSMMLLAKFAQTGQGKPTKRGGKANSLAY